MAPYLVYDNAFAVVALLFAVATFAVPGFSVSPEDRTRLARYLGPAGQARALELHQEFATNQPAPQWPVPSFGHPYNYPFQYPGQHPFTYPAFAPTPLSPIAPAPAVAYSALANTQAAMATPVISNLPSAPPIPSTKALGKRKATADPDAPPPPPKKQRKKAPPNPTKVVCMWQGQTDAQPCGVEIRADEFSSHMLSYHYSGVEYVSHVTTRQFCRWSEGCPKDSRTKDGFKDLTALMKHLQDVHFRKRATACARCGREMRGDIIKRHRC